jgi:hypothetical protein
MPNQGKDIQHPKARGEWAEMRFMTRAAEHNLTVTKPWGESSHYDFIIDCRGRFLRIQVKSTMFRKNNSYAVNVHGGKAYSKGDFDFLAAYIIPIDLWYIIPADLAITGQEKLYVTPDSPNTKYEPYREAWHLLLASGAGAAPANHDVGASVPLGQPGETSGDEHAPTSPEGEDPPEHPFVAQFRAIKWNPVFPNWKPRR